ncbi:MAG TPA: hypothetical protein EYO73_06095 [Sulfurimonas sp.]|nr:hypothetical protein [Sulfurimonas sp.]
MIFWIYTLSGMRLYHAIVSSSIVFLLGIIGPYFFYPQQSNAFLFHLTWMIISFAFDLIGGFLMQDFKKVSFLK